MRRLFRATVMHTPRDPFKESQALEVFEDGAVVVENGIIYKTGDFGALSKEAEIVDLRPGILLPGFVDTHVHYPQVYNLGAMGLSLLAWLKERILPGELRFSDPEFARQAARDFLAGLIRSGTTTALVFGVHDVRAQDILFEEAQAAGLRMISGLITSDRNLLPEMHKTPARAQAEDKL